MLSGGVAGRFLGSSPTRGENNGFRECPSRPPRPPICQRTSHEGPIEHRKRKTVTLNHCMLAVIQPFRERETCDGSPPLFPPPLPPSPHTTLLNELDEDAGLTRWRSRRRQLNINDIDHFAIDLLQTPLLLRRLLHVGVMIVPLFRGDEPCRRGAEPSPTTLGGPVPRASCRQRPTATAGKSRRGPSRETRPTDAVGSRLGPVGTTASGLPHRDP